MSRFSFRSLAVAAAIAATPIAAHFYSSGAGSGGENAGSVIQETARTAAAHRGQPDAASESPDSPNSEEVTKAADAASDAGEGALAGTICNFLQEYPQSGSANPADLEKARARAAPPAAENRSAPVEIAIYPEDDKALPCMASQGNTQALRPRVLLAIVPDPIRTRLELRFDRSIDDIEDAVQKRGWQFDSNWLPWDNRTHEEPERFGERLLDQTVRRARANTAGVLLFRTSGGAGSAAVPLIVLLVGDTPIAGVDAGQFRSAMRMWRRLRGPPSVPAELDILGPSFSGSVQSLAHLLPQELHASAITPSDLCGGITVSIAAGSVSSSDQLNSLNHPQGPGFCSTVISFAVDGQYQAGMLREYLHWRSPCKRIASLVEGESAFGSSLLQTPESQTSGRKSRQPDGNPRGRCATADPYLELHFPRGIARLREAYEANAIIGFASSGDSPRSELRFETGDEHHGTDTVPSFSSTQQPLAMEAQMAAIARTLDEQRVSTALLSATDVFDEIFVARYLQQHAPRVTIIIQDADLLFLRRGQDAALQNTFVASPWPLIPENQFWTGGSSNPEIRISPSQNDQGFYAATLHLLQCPPAQPCTSPPPEYRSPFSALKDFQQRPPLWLSMIGRGAFAPVALVDADLEAARQKDSSIGPLPVLKPTNEPRISPPDGTRPPPGVSAELPLQTKLLVTVIAAMLLWHGFACIFSRMDRRFAWSYALADASQRTPRLLVQSLLSFSAVPALRVLLVPSATGFSVNIWRLWLWVALLQILSIVLSVWAIRRLWIGSRRYARMSEPRQLRAERHSARLALEEHLRLESDDDAPPLRRAGEPARRSKPASAAYLHRLANALRFLRDTGHDRPRLSDPDDHLRLETEDDAPHFRRPVETRAPRVLHFTWAHREWPVILAAIVFVLATLLIDRFLWPALEPRELADRAFFLYRSALMTPGVSPSLTILLLITALAFWGHSYFARLAFFGHRIPDLPKRHTDVGCPSAATVAPVTELFSNSRPGHPFVKGRRANLWIFGLAAALVVVILRVSSTWGPTSIENGGFDVWTRMLAGVLATAILYDIGVATWGWSMLHQHCLLPLKRSPLRWGFTWIKGFSWRRLWTSSYVLSPDLVFDYLSRMLQASNRAWALDPALRRAQRDLLSEYYDKRPKDEAWSRDVSNSLVRLHVLLASRADHMLDVLQQLWAQDRGPLTGSEKVRGLPLQKKPETGAALDRMAAEEFVALLYLGYIRMVLIQVRNRILTALICYVLLLWALTSYSWTNHHAIIVALSTLLALLSVAVIYIYSGMHRDDILSRTTETTPGKLDSEFFEKTVPTLGIPLLSLIATQFPEFSDLIFSFIEPGLRGH